MVFLEHGRPSRWVCDVVLCASQRCLGLGQLVAMYFMHGKLVLTTCLIPALVLIFSPRRNRAKPTKACVGEVKHHTQFSGLSSNELQCFIHTAFSQLTDHQRIAEIVQYFGPNLLPVLVDSWSIDNTTTKVAVRRPSRNYFAVSK